MKLEYGFAVGRVLKGVALLFLAVHLLFSALIQLHYLSTLEFEQPAIDAINMWYNLIIVPAGILAVWAIWMWVGPLALEFLSRKTNKGEVDQ